MEKFKKLSREELKNTVGGTGCTLTFSDGHGGWITKTGKCKVPVSMDYVGSGFYPVASGPSFCDIGNGVSYPLSSNGGNSRC